MLMQSRSNLKSCVVVKQEGHVGEQQKCLARQYVELRKLFQKLYRSPCFRLSSNSMRSISALRRSAARQGDRERAENRKGM
jgi:hypothetical protein